MAIKTILGFSPLTERIYLGKINDEKPTEWIGDKVDITGNFIQVMLRKFPVDSESTLAVNGEAKYKVIVERIEK